MTVRTPNLNVHLAADDAQRLVVEIYDDIGPSWLGLIDTKSVAAAIKAQGDVKQIDVRINSLGGSAFDGLGIYNVLKQHPAQVHVRVDGVAASAASLIAMAGDTVEMPENALLMIHEPWIIAVGNQDELKKTTEMLGKVNDSGIATYQAKSGQSRQQIAKWLNDETWFTAAEAVEAGLADKVLKAPAEAKSITVREPFSFKNPPSQLAALLAGPTGAPQMQTKVQSPESSVQSPATEAAVEERRAESGEQLSAGSAAVEEVLEVDFAAEVRAALAADRKRQSDIRALCRQAACPELGDHFAFSTEPEFSVEDVRSELFTRLCKVNAAPADSGDEAAGDDEADAAFKAEYKKNKRHLTCSEEDYVASRRIDEGLEVLAVGAAA